MFSLPQFYTFVERVGVPSAVLAGCLWIMIHTAITIRTMVNKQPDHSGKDRDRDDRSTKS